MDSDNMPPAKWVKHNVLVLCGLRELSELTADIHRYNIYEYGNCLNEISNDLSAHPDQYTYIVKLVYSRSIYKLPNIIITNQNDCVKARELLSTKVLSEFKEIWYCKNPNFHEETVFGRLSFSNDALFPRLCPVEYEIIWGRTARQIDDYPYMKDSYIRLHRESWNTEVKIMDCIANGLSPEFIEKTAFHIIERVSYYTHTIKDFGTYAFMCGCNQISIEFVTIQ